MRSARLPCVYRLLSPQGDDCGALQSAALSQLMDWLWGSGGGAPCCPASSRRCCACCAFALCRPPNARQQGAWQARRPRRGAAAAGAAPAQEGEPSWRVSGASRLSVQPHAPACNGCVPCAVRLVRMGTVCLRAVWPAAPPWVPARACCRSRAMQRSRKSWSCGWGWCGGGGHAIALCRLLPAWTR